ncbi:MAG: hypothetical protein HYZ72_01975 [Deltaproteobacteria bacterium]|nr:hypothetical protein [Deltaproteobacteria bacterium]
MQHRETGRLPFVTCARGILLLLLASCARTRLPVSPPASLVFPPQRVMENGNYAEFLAENERRLQTCGAEQGCDVVLFNLGFAYAYPQSPYRDLAKALQRFSELRVKYPQSPLAVQGQAWMALINEYLALEESQRKLQTDLRNKEAAVRTLQERLNRSRDIDIEMQKKERELLH